MSFQTNIQAAFVAVGTDVKALLSKVGVLANLTTTAKSDLVGAINEVNAKAGATIDDTGTSATKVWSSSKTNTAINQVKTDILGGASAAYDTLLEIQNIIGTDESTLSGLVTAVGNKAAAADLTALTNAVGDTSTDFAAIYNTAKA